MDHHAEDVARMRELIVSAGAAGCSEPALQHLVAAARDEERAVRAAARHYAVRLGRAAPMAVAPGAGHAHAQHQHQPLDVDCVRLACLERRLLQPPVRAAALEAARIINSRTVAWPLGAGVRVTAAAAAAGRADALLGGAALPRSAAALVAPSATAGFAIAAGRMSVAFSVGGGASRGAKRQREPLAEFVEGE